tara:strand:- start:427 stop:543 length:117 start_codon:yes stop_codon:yes gene_type:complete
MHDDQLLTRWKHFVLDIGKASADPKGMKIEVCQIFKRQ